MDVSSFLKGAADRSTKTVLLAPDPDAVQTAAEVARAAFRGETLADSPDPDELGRVQAEASASAWAFTLGTVGRSVWQQLADAHPPSVRQQEQAKAEGAALRWNLETFPQAAIAACLRRATNPDGDVVEFKPTSVDGDGDVQADPAAVELVSAVWERFPFGDTQRLWLTVVELNVSAPATAKLASFGNG